MRNLHLYFSVFVVLLQINNVFGQIQQISNSQDGIKDQAFSQEYQRAYPLGKEVLNNDVRRVLIDKHGKVWAGTKAGLFSLNQSSGKWQAMLDTANQGPINDLFEDSKGNVWIAAWNGLFKSVNYEIGKMDVTDLPVAAISENTGTLLVLGVKNIWENEDGAWLKEKIPYSKVVRKLISDEKNGFYLATGKGLYHIKQDTAILFQNGKELLSDNVFGLTFAQNNELWVAGLGGITVYKNDERIKSYTPKNGLPNAWARCVEKAPDGTMWVGTDMGIARYDGATWSIRHSRRWLLSDKVRDIAFDKNGTAWVATSKGISAIKRREMTLSQKADYYYNILQKRHVRKPWLVEKCRFQIPGDTINWEPNDDDNDGQYTSMYLVMESYRYAVSKSPEAKKNAENAFNALKFLQTITGTDGFVARTVVPSSWTRMADANRTISDREWAWHQYNDSRAKRIPNHWVLSKDKKWYWKRGTSSDEITGHMYGYLFYYDLVADKKEKKRVKEQILRIVDYIINNDYVLIDIDGTKTEWGVWAPKYLMDDPDWISERNINSVEILSYLKLAYHVSGDKHYQKEYNKLLNKYNYRNNIEFAKTILPAWRTYIDDELLALAYPALLLYEDEPGLKRLYRKSLENWYDALKDDDSPYFYFLYNAFAGNKLNLEKSTFLLQDNPLDLIRWRVDNGKREDLHLTRRPILEDIQINRLVPPSERGIMRWDNNPWKAVQGDGGYTESDGVYWLLAYWMGRYYGLIQ